MSYKCTGDIRVLYIEDEKHLQLAVSLMLGKLGYEVICVGNGQLGIEQAESWKPDVILIDLTLPLISGEEVIRILRNKPATAKTPIFVLSGLNNAETREACKEAGATKFYPKPADIRNIGAAIKQILTTPEQDESYTEKNILTIREIINIWVS